MPSENDKLRAIAAHAGVELDAVGGQLQVEHYLHIDIRQLAATLARWSQHTFGSDAERGPEKALAHLRRELGELDADPFDLEEYADVGLLLLDAARRAGHSVDDLLLAMAVKHVVNLGRDWSAPDAEGVIEHVREDGPAHAIAALQAERQEALVAAADYRRELQRRQRSLNEWSQITDDLLQSQRVGQTILDRLTEYDALKRRLGTLYVLALDWIPDECWDRGSFDPSLAASATADAK